MIATIAAKYDLSCWYQLRQNCLGCFHKLTANHISLHNGGSFLAHIKMVRFVCPAPSVAKLSATWGLQGGRSRDLETGGGGTYLLWCGGNISLTKASQMAQN